MAAATLPAKASGPSVMARLARATPYLLLFPGIAYLVIFYAIPSFQMFLYSISTGNVDAGYQPNAGLANYATAIQLYTRQLWNSILYGGLATILTLLIGFPVAYTVAFRGGRYKNFILFLVIAPFFTSFLIRTISWKILLGDEGPLLGTLKHAFGILPADFSLTGTALAQVAGITYNFLPFMILPLYVALEKIDPRMLEAAGDLYANRIEAFRRITVPLALPGIFAGTLLTFIPAMGDYINAELLGNPTTQMIGNVIQRKLLVQNDFAVGAALSFILMAGILVAVFVYARVLGTEQLTG
ncbi:MAG: ABC transporter permease [Candidatus Limnocylindrales bacterium]